MTIVRAGFVGVDLTPELKQRLADRIIGAFNEVEVGKDNPAVRSGFLLIFERFGADDVWNGSQPFAQVNPSGKAAVIQTQVMAGPWTNEMKAELFDRVQRVLREEAGIPEAPRGWDIWMTFTEIPEGSWGVGGKAVSIRSIAPAFTEDRRERIQSYLAQLESG